MPDVPAPMSKVRAEFEVDFTTRRVTAKIWRELDIEPTVLTVPFATWKSIAAGIVAAEAEAEKVSERNGRPQLVAPA